MFYYNILITEFFYSPLNFAPQILPYPTPGLGCDSRMLFAGWYNLEKN